MPLPDNFSLGPKTRGTKENHDRFLTTGEIEIALKKETDGMIKKSQIINWKKLYECSDIPGITGIQRQGISYKSILFEISRRN